MIDGIKSYHNGPGYLIAENILADVTCPFTLFISGSGKWKILRSICLDLYTGQNFHRSKDQKQEDFKAKLKTKVQTNKDKPDPKTVEPEQVDFRNMLKKGSVKTKVNQQFKTEQVDFRNQALKNQGYYNKLLTLANSL